MWYKSRQRVRGSQKHPSASSARQRAAETAFINIGNGTFTGRVLCNQTPSLPLCMFDSQPYPNHCYLSSNLNDGSLLLCLFRRSDCGRLMSSRSEPSPSPDALIFSLLPTCLSRIHHNKGAVFNPTSSYLFEDVGLCTQQNSRVFTSSAPTLRAANKRPVPTFPDMCPLMCFHSHTGTTPSSTLRGKQSSLRVQLLVHSSNTPRASAALRKRFRRTLCVAVTFPRPGRPLINQCGSFCVALRRRSITPC